MNKTGEKETRKWKTRERGGKKKLRDEETKNEIKRDGKEKMRK